MGKSIDVEGFFYLPDLPQFQANSSVKHARIQRQTEILGHIHRHFSWHSIPWGEPNDKSAGEGASLQWQTFGALIKFAHAVASKYEQTDDRLAFHQLTTRYDNGEMAIYLPIEFESPFLIECSDYPERCTVGSSLSLLTELEALESIFAIEQQSLTDSREDMPLIGHSIDVLLRFARLSKEVNLPLFLSW